MRVYMAAFETQKKNYDIKLDVNCGIFLSYFYQKIVDKVLPDIKASGHKGVIVIDSGAHSFFEEIGVSATAKNKKKDGNISKDPEVFFKSYVKWVKENYDYFDYFVELDLQEIVSQKRVNEWRQIYKEEGISDKCIMVHHSFNNEEEFFELLDKYQTSGYIGLEGIRPGYKVMDYNFFLKQAYERGIKVHGFAFTRSQLLYKYPFFSVDSSSWTTPIRYGVHGFFYEGEMKSCSEKKDYFRFNRPIAMHSSFRTKDDSRVKLEIHHLEYLKLQDFFTKLWEGRGVFWTKKIIENGYTDY